MYGSSVADQDWNKTNENSRNLLHLESIPYTLHASGKPLSDSLGNAETDGKLLLSEGPEISCFNIGNQSEYLFSLNLDINGNYLVEVHSFH